MGNHRFNNRCANLKMISCFFVAVFFCSRLLLVKVKTLIGSEGTGEVFQASLDAVYCALPELLFDCSVDKRRR